MSNHSLAQSYNSKADNLMIVIMSGLFVYSLALATMYQTWMMAIIIGGASLAATIAICKMAPGTLVSRCVVAAAFMIMCALHIDQTRGMIEAHFGIFALLAMLLYYRDWRPIIVAAAVIAVHHLLFFSLQNSGSNVWVIGNTERGWGIIFMHAGYVIAETAALVLIAMNLAMNARQSEELQETVSRLVDGNRVHLDVRCKDTTGKATQAFNQFLEVIENLVTQVTDTSQNLQSNNSKMSSATGAVNTDIQKQQAEIQAMASAFVQLTAATEEIARHTSATASNASSATDSAREGRDCSQTTRHGIQQLAEQLTETSNAVGQLAQETDSIGSVLEVIRGIAEQTNLLALNAAIEAARAGEQGRGFAVVADEVRTLASRTQNSTQEIQAMIERLQQGSNRTVSAMQVSQETVQTCIENTNRTSDLLEGIVAAVSTIADTSQSIASSTTEQHATVEEVSRNSSRIKELGDANVRQLQLAMQAVKALSDSAGNLQSQLSRIQTGGY